MTQRRWVRAGAAVAVVCAVAAGGVACTAEPVDVPFIVHPRAPDGGSRHALISGVLELRDGCLFLVSTPLGKDLVLALPDSVRWRDEGVLIIGGTSYRMGDEVEIGSGMGGTVAGYRASTRAGVRVPDACPDDAEVWALD